MITNDPSSRIAVTGDRTYERSFGSQTSNEVVAESSTSAVVRTCARSAAVEEATPQLWHLPVTQHAPDYRHASAQEAQCLALGHRQAYRPPTDGPAPTGQQCSLDICLHDGWMDVAVAAHRPGGAEVVGHLVDDLVDHALGRITAILGPLNQALCSTNGRIPCSKGLGGDAHRGVVAEVPVDIRRTDDSQRAVGRAVLEQLLTRQVLAAANDGRQSFAVNCHVEVVRRLAFERHPDSRAAHHDVTVAERGEAERLVGAGVLGVADSQAGDVEQADDGRHDAIVIEVISAKVAIDPPA